MQLGFEDLEVDGTPELRIQPFRMQLLKWIGNKQRFAHEIASYFPEQFRTYYEPFLGSGAVMAALAPTRAVGSDALEPLIEIFQTLLADPDLIKGWYAKRWETMMVRAASQQEGYELIKDSYNSNPNGADLLMISRACYGGVVRFRQDGHLSTPCGVHRPIGPESFSLRVDEWRSRLRGASFRVSDFSDTMSEAKRGDVVYCDPPYTHSQAILYGAHTYQLDRLLADIDRCKSRGVYVALSIDGSKRSGNLICDVPIPPGLFERQAMVNCGRSMLRRFQMDGGSLEGEEVQDRLLLTY
jgi:DNA adenine methylase